MCLHNKHVSYKCVHDTHWSVYCHYATGWLARKHKWVERYTSIRCCLSSWRQKNDQIVEKCEQTKQTNWVCMQNHYGRWKANMDWTYSISMCMQYSFYFFHFFAHFSENIFKTVTKKKILFSRKTVHSAEIERNISPICFGVCKGTRTHTYRAWDILTHINKRYELKKRIRVAYLNFIVVVAVVVVFLSLFFVKYIDHRHIRAHTPFANIAMGQFVFARSSKTRSFRWYSVVETRLQ